MCCRHLIYYDFFCTGVVNVLIMAMNTELELSKSQGKVNLYFVVQGTSHAVSQMLVSLLSNKCKNKGNIN